jgi:hypothetical protein
MELKDYVRMEIGNLKRGMSRALDGLTQQEIMWRPASGCNSIGIILLHTARSEDSMIQCRLREKPETWETEKWHEKLNLPVTEAGAHFTVEQVNAFVVPELKDLLGYYDAVRAQTSEYLKGMTPEAFDKKITWPNMGELAAAAVLMIIVGHTSQHIGEISYLRGLQRGMDK